MKRNIFYFRKRCLSVFFDQKHFIKALAAAALTPQACPSWPLAVQPWSGTSKEGPVHLGVGGVGDAEVQLGVELGQLVGWIDRRLQDVYRTNLYDVPDGELVDGQAFGGKPWRTVGAATAVVLPEIHYVTCIVKNFEIDGQYMGKKLCLELRSPPRWPW